MSIDPVSGSAPAAGGSAVVAKRLPEAHATSRAHTDRLGGVDWLRILAIFGVAYFHAADPAVNWYVHAPGAKYAFAGLHALTAAATYFACASRSATSDGDLLWKRFNRLLVPWLFFGTIFTLKAIHNGKFHWAMLLVGGATHLWFLPFIFVVGCTLSIAARHNLIRQSLPGTIGWTTASIVAMAIEPYVGPLLPDVPPTWQIVNALPAALAGVAIYVLPTRTLLPGLLACITGAGLVIWWTIPATFAPGAWPAAAPAGAVLFGIALLLPIRSTRASTFVGRTSFGVYLLHMVVLGTVVTLYEKLAGIDVSGLASEVGTLTILAQIALTVLFAMGVVTLLERTPLRGFVS